jgi:amino acid transporter
MIAYILMFLAAIRLRKKMNSRKDSYHMPGGTKGLWITCIIGICGAGFGLIIGFFPPSQLDTGSIFRLETFLIGGSVLFFSLPFLIYKLRKPHWRPHA